MEPMSPETDRANAGNPYAATSASAMSVGASETLALETAGRWRRFFNWLVDYVVLMLIAFVVMFVYGMTMAMTRNAAAIEQMQQPNPLRDYGVGFAITFAYYIAMEGLFGLTIGKLVTGTRVVNEKGGRPTFGQAVGRTLCRMIPFEPFSLLFAGDGEARGWHDSIPRTYVVRKR